jgi:NADP-dependent 3-hydroxy acid dehydrogenase YdfG
MADQGTVVVIGGTNEFGKRIAKHYADAGHPVVVTSRYADKASALAGEIGGNTQGLAVDLTRPHDLVSDLQNVSDVQYLVITPVERDGNNIHDYDIDAAMGLVIMKMLGYPGVINALLPRMRERASIVLFGGQARDIPYPGSTTVTSVNGGVTSMLNTLAIEIAPRRINAIHPSIVGDSPFWAEKRAVIERLRENSLLGELVMVDDVVDAVIFLLENPGLTAVNLTIDAGTRLT